MELTCQTDPRRDAVRRQTGRNGLDCVEVGDDHVPTLYVYFLGKLPPELAVNRPGIERYLQIEGGERITALRILDADPQVQADPERDDVLVLTLDREGDFSSYTLRLVGVEGIDPRYDTASFRFRVDCGSDLDCKPDCGCEPPAAEAPQINYLAKDYASFRQLILDRLALLMPGWTERHVPDLGITLVELLAYTGDQLSYTQDAVATEAYLGTARQRISVRRHARLVDYVLHEGCNARAWLHLHVSGPVELPADDVAFITG
ncbi:MAG: putative baseplate assembly protein, partial [Burkholderiales bacterium]|nr:putative baseplate assembly protein [Burkholderiales bacterium]